MGNNSSNLTPESLEGAWFCGTLKFEIRHVTADRGLLTCWEQESMLVNEWVFKYEQPIMNIGNGLTFAGYMLKKSDIPRKRGPGATLLWTHWSNGSTVRWTRRYVRQSQFIQECQNLNDHLVESGLRDFYEVLRSQNYAGKIDKLASITTAELSKFFCSDQILRWRRVYPEPELKESQWVSESVVVAPSIILDNEFDVGCDQFMHKLSRFPSEKVAILCRENLGFRSLIANHPKPTLRDVQEFFTLPNGDQDVKALKSLNAALAEHISTEAFPSSPSMLRSCASSSLREFDPDLVLDDIWGEEEAEDDLLADLWMNANLLSDHSTYSPHTPVISGRLKVVNDTML